MTACDREPIHIPGSIQPHGLLLIADASTLEIVGGAGDIEARLAPGWLGKQLGDVLHQDISEALEGTELGPGATLSLDAVEGVSELFEVAAHASAGRLLIELEPVAVNPRSRRGTLAWLDAVASQFERTPNLRALCERAAVAFRELTGYDRVMVYRFLDDEAGTVIAEDRAPKLGTFLNHHFPATDIPKQARQLYVRNRIRVIPDVDYRPAPIRPAGAGLGATDLSDVSLRSVSPIHVQYLKNMGIAASASVSIVKDGLLWGLIACHNEVPLGLSQDVRAAANALAGGLARQIRSKEDAERYRERLRLRAAEDALLSQLGPDQNYAAALDPMRQLLGADGFALIGQDRLLSCGVTPPEPALRELGRWLGRQASDGEVFATATLVAEYPQATAYAAQASGLLSFALPGQDGLAFAWFRCEQLEEVNWAGNPHKAVSNDPDQVLTPRASFASWSETVRGRSRRWTLEETDAARRLRRALLDARQNRRLRELNRELGATVAEKEDLLRQNDYLIKEVNHRVQNSLQLVASFLGLQARAVEEPLVREHLAEAQNRLSAVAQVHRRLHQDDRVETVDLARYLTELCADIGASHGDESVEPIDLDLSPVLVKPERAVSIGLVVTELMINARKYAYRGVPGPVAVRLRQHNNQLILAVADQGAGKQSEGTGFGTRMMKAMVARIGGELDYQDNEPGVRAVLTAPIN